MLVKVGWTKDMVDKQIPFIPISGWRGDNLLKTTDSKNVLNMDWWAGHDVEAAGEKVHVSTFYDFLDSLTKSAVSQRAHEEDTSVEDFQADLG